MKTPYPLLVSLIIFVSCNKTNTDKPASDVTVYICGVAVDSNGSSPLSVYWEDSVAHYLSGSRYTSAEPESIVYSDGQVYIGGRTYNIGLQKPFYWRDNTLVEPESSDSSIAGFAYSISVSASDVYLAGRGTNSQGEYKDNHGVAKFWKNGQPHWITSDTIESYASAINVSGPDVHIIWYTNIVGQLNYHGWYYKNGENVSLDGQHYNSVPIALCLSEQDVYILGYIYDFVSGRSFYAYWKNGQMNELSLGSQVNTVGGFAVSDGDIYIAAVDYSVGEGQAAYWKNGVKYPLTNGNFLSSVSGIAIDGTDVYVSGTDNGAPLYWKNGTPHMLGGLPPYTKYDTRGIVVVRK